jgi:Zn-dependent protease with chaperone function
MTMNARAIAPALSLLLLATTLPVPPAGAQSTAPPAHRPPGAPPAPWAPPAPNSATPPVTISDEKFYTESAQAAVEETKEWGAYDNAAELARVNRIGYELAQHADFYKYPITFSLVGMAEPNSAANPAGQILVTRGMLDMVGPDDDMLACVLGHEIGHVIREHYLHMSRRATLMSILGNLLVAGVLISSAKNPPRSGVEGPYDPRVGYDPGGGNRIEGAAAASLIVSELMLRSYSRDNEDEADQVGQRLAAAAGYNPDGAQRLWQLMESRAPQARQYGYLQTHPFAQERIRAAEARKGSWSIRQRQPAARFRERTQEVLVAYAQHQRIKDAMAQKAPKKRQQEPEAPRSAEALQALQPPATISEYVTLAALATWPTGPAADSLRLARLHHLRDTKLASCPGTGPSTLDYLPGGREGGGADTGGQGGPGGQGTGYPGGPGSGGGRGGPGGRSGRGGAGSPDGQEGQRGMRMARARGVDAGSCAPELHDYGAVVRAYRKELAELQALDPMGPMPPLVPALNGEIAELETQRKALYPRALEVFKGGVYETAFLVAFVSNFPDSPELPKVALDLGDAYSRTGDETDAVANYLTAWKAGSDDPFGKRAAAGLRNLTPNLKELAALQELAIQQQDPEMGKMAAARLEKVSRTYDDLANGAEYLRRFPSGAYVIPVLDRLNVLADNLYGEVVLYQGFGDATKAIDRINKILTNAPLSPAAEKLRDRAVLVADKTG